MDSQAEIENHILDFYSNLYASDNSYIDNGLIYAVILDLVTSRDNCILTNIPSMEEVKDAIFSLDKNSAPGFNGFGGNFYHASGILLGRMFITLSFNSSTMDGSTQI